MNREIKSNQVTNFLSKTTSDFVYSCPFYRMTYLEGERREIVKRLPRNATAIRMGGYRQ